MIPTAGRIKSMEELHESHPGIVRMKSLARSYVWWPGMDKDLETKVAICSDCQRIRKSPPPAILHPWEWPTRPWARLHVDYAGPFMGKMFLVVVDAHSKWMNVVTTATATSRVTIKALRSIFSTHGLPELLVSDNGAVFTSEEFKVFLQRNGIRHRVSAPYHPASNGLAERAVQTLKQVLKKHRNKPRNPPCSFSLQLPDHTPSDHGSLTSQITLWKEAALTFGYPSSEHQCSGG